MESLPKCSGIAQQRNETLREVVAVRHCPQRRAIALYDDLLPLPHPLHQPPSGIARHQGAVVGVRWPDDRGGETFLAVCAYQPILTSDLVSGVLPVRVVEWCGLCHRHAGRWSLIGRSGTDED